MAPKLPEACSHIAQAISEIESYATGLPDNEIIRDPMRLRAIERCLQIITEAAKYIPDADRAQHSEIDWESMISMGHILRHEYFQLNSDVIMRVVRHDLPALKTAIRSLSPISTPGPAKKT